MNNTVIETKKIFKKFSKIQAVTDLNLKVERGTAYALLGSNGAGKTTTIKMLMNIIQPTSGSVEVFGKATTKLGQGDFQKIGYVSENQKLPLKFTLRKLIAYLKPMYPGWSDETCEKMIKSFELPLDRKLGKLSRGMKMKAALATSLAYNPELLVLDEPFSGLDPVIREEFIDSILDLMQQENWTILISSHEISDIERLIDHVGFLQNGKLLLSQSLDDLYGTFLRVYVSCKEEVSSFGFLPESWTNFKSEGKRSQFIYTDGLGGELSIEVENIFGKTAEFSTETMSLKDIFVAHARNYKFQLK